ncbi:hypothetical protein LTS12_025805 [Elasticomyces elasticus]|nr:hypothetical protein LTS12_025805 [Elasticomyces elasticus]
MSAVAEPSNGALTPPAASTQLSTSTTDTSASALKRKRDDDAETAWHGSEESALPRYEQIQRDILDLLQQQETSPSFLKHEFSDRPITNEPSHKKARLSVSVAKTSISDKLASGAYASLALLGQDAARVSRELESAIRAKTANGERDGGRLPVEDLKQVQRVKAFEQLVKEVVVTQGQYDSARRTDVVKKEVESKVNGHFPTAKDNGRAGTVLTLFGNAPTPKQLFSSMQNSPSRRRDTVIKSELLVEEMSLPNGLTATKIVPTPINDTKKAPTFEETFAPPYNLPALHPPKAHKRSSTRDTTVTWAFKDTINRGSKKGGYTVQALATGEWLHYGGVDPSDAKEKRKQRERALSSGAEAAKEPVSETSLAEQQAREEEALFRRAYSSFAPSHDNSKAIIPAEIKSMLWWHKVGAQRYQDTFAIDPALVDEESATTMLPSLDAEAVVEDVDLEKVMENLDTLDVDMEDIEQATTKTDIDRVLRETSELLETLASHQRIRSSNLTSSAVASRTPISPAPALAAKIGKPDEPAEDEVSTYHALRREIAYLVLKLPPYAVAKLDGDQLADLGVSTLIPVHTKNVKGIMEEDQVARLAKHNAMATTASITSLTRSTSSTAGQHYSTTAQRTPAIGQAANTRYGSSAQFGASRTPATQPQVQRSTSNQASYSTPSTTTTRQGYGQQPNQYTRPAVPQQGSYSQPNGQSQYYQQRPAATPATSSYYGTQYAQSSAAQPARPAYSPASSQPLQQFQQRAAANAVAYSANSNSQQIRTGSPANVQPRPVYPAQYNQQQPNSGRATPTAYSASQPPTPVNVNGYARPQQLVAPKASVTPQPNGV